MSHDRGFHSALQEFKRRPEHELLLLSARAGLEPAQQARVREIAGGGIDYSALFTTARRHRLFPLVWSCLNTVCPDAVPSGVKDVMGRQFQEYRLFALTAASEMAKIVSALQRGGVEALALKGPVLSEEVYGDLASREYKDIDLYVRPRDAVLAKSLLDGMGFPYRWGPSRRRENAVLGPSCRHYEVLREPPYLDLDLHWDLFPSSFHVPFVSEELFSCSRLVRLGGVEIRTLGVEDLLLFLCAHAGKHSFNCLLWIADVAGMVRLGNEVDWPRLLRRAKQMGIERIVATGLILASDLLGAPLPSAVCPRAGTEIDGLAAESLRFFLLPEKLPIREKMGFRFHARERWTDRLRDGSLFLSSLLKPTPLEWDALRLPDELFFCYYLYRPLRLAKKYSSRLVRRPEAA